MTRKQRTYQQDLLLLRLALLLPLYLWAFATNAQTLELSLVEQEQTNWCWAASSEAIIEYYIDTDVNQCDIANWVREAEDWSNTNCCDFPGDPDSCNQVINDLGKYSGGSIRTILQNWGVNSENDMYCHEDPFPDQTPDWDCGALSRLDADIINQWIANDQVFIMHFASGSGHFVVGHGFQPGLEVGQDSLVSYMDPWYNIGFQVARYDWLVDNKGWNLTLAADMSRQWSVTKVMLAGDTPPGNVFPEGSYISEVSGNIYGMVKGFDVNDQGNVSYIAKLMVKKPDSDEFVHEQAIFTSAGEVIARSGQNAPGGGRLGAFYLPGDYRFISINNANEIVYQAVLEDGTQGLFTRNTSIARQGDPAPDGGSFESFFGHDINTHGHVTFFAKTRSSSEIHNGLYLWDGESVTRIQSDEVSGGIPVLRNDDTVAYLVYPTNIPVGGAGGDPRGAIVSSSPNRYYAVAGEAAPGGGYYASGPMKFNYPDATEDTAAEAVFLAELDSGQEGIFTSQEKQSGADNSGVRQRRIAVVGESASEGGTFTELEGMPSINNLGRVVYVARTSDGRHAIFDTDGLPVAITQQTLVSSAVVVDLADPVLTNEGQVVFYAKISNDSGFREGLLLATKNKRHQSP